MTVEKQKRMTQKELEDYDQAQRAKQWYEAIGDMFPAGWRWKQAMETVVAESMNIESWFGLKLGLDYYLSSTEPEWKIALPPPLEPPYPQVQLNLNSGNFILNKTRFTISMEILGLLFESNFDPVRGWAFKPRPGAEYFMSKVGFPNSELVFFTEASGQDILPIIDRFASDLDQFCTFSDLQRNSSDISKRSSRRWLYGSSTEIHADTMMEITRKILMFSGEIQKRYKIVLKIYF